MSQTTQFFVDRETGRVVLRSPLLGHSAAWSTVQEVVGRVLSVKCVDTVELNRELGTATIQPTGNRESASDAPLMLAPELREIASGLRNEVSPGTPINDAYGICRQVCFQKTDGGISAAKIVHSIRGRVRMRHPLVRRNSHMALRVETSLALIPGVQSVSASVITGSVVVVFDKTLELSSTLPAALEQVVCMTQEMSSLVAGPSTIQWIASGTCLSLALTSTFVAPVLAPATAVALVGFNLTTMGRGITELCTLRWRIASLYTVIMGTTLISGQFLAAALMQTSIACWHGWSSRRLREVITRLKSAFKLTLVSGDHRYIESADEDFTCPRLGSVVEFTTGMPLSCDGIVVEGKAEIDEQCIRGVASVAVKSIGEQVFAGCTLLRGQLSVRVTAARDDTRLAHVRRTLLDSIEELPGSGEPTERSHSVGSRFVPFTFVAGTAALAVGDISTLAAVLRPDFTTGPSISERFGALSQIGLLLDQGWLVKSTDTLHLLTSAEAVVMIRINPTTAFEEPRSTESNNRPESTDRQLKRRRVNLFWRQIDFHEIEGDEEFCVDYVRQLQRSKRKVVVVGCGRALKRLTNDNVVRVLLTTEDSFENQSADVIALDPKRQQVKELLSVLHESNLPREQGWAAVIACNALAISGAFVIGFTSLHVVVLTNLGVLAAGALYDKQFRRAGRLLTPRVQKELPGGREAFN